MTENDENAQNDHLMDFVKNTETPAELENKNIQHFGSNTREKVTKIELNNEWQEISLKDLPYGKFYPIGTHLYVRPATTKEIQGFAVINEKNPHDVQLKLNEVLSSCTKLVYLDGSEGNYKSIQDGDRDTISIIISKVTAKAGKKLEKTVSCDCTPGGHEEKIELVPANYKYIQENEDIAQFFDHEKRVYVFPISIDGTDIDVSLAPPTIGLTEDINNYIFYKVTKSEGKILPNITFMQTIPYMKAGLGVKNLSIEELENEEFKFTKISSELFEFIYDTIELINFGVEKLTKQCSKCGKELTSTFTFPSGARALFIVPNAFKQYIRQ